MLSVKQGGIKYHFLSLWYDLTWNGTQVSQAIGEHSNHYANVRYIPIFMYICVCVWLHLKAATLRWSMIVGISYIVIQGDDRADPFFFVIDPYC